MDNIDNFLQVCSLKMGKIIRTCVKYLKKLKVIYNKNNTIKNNNVPHHYYSGKYDEEMEIVKINKLF